jgi:hypothetical protein
MKDLSGVAKSDSKVNGQYRFHSHDDVTAALHPLLVKHGVTMIPTTKTITQEGNRTAVVMNIVFTNVDNPPDSFVVEYPGYGVDASDKGPGKAISYACKYAALKTFNLATGDDPDNDAKSKFEPVKCTEFEALVPEKTSEKAMQKFLEHSAEAMGKHIEDVKREAVKRMDDFMKGYEKWLRKQKELKEKV